MINNTKHLFASLLILFSLLLLLIWFPWAARRPSRLLGASRYFIPCAMPAISRRILLHNYIRFEWHEIECLPVDGAFCFLALTGRRHLNFAMINGILFLRLLVYAWWMSWDFVFMLLSVFVCSLPVRAVSKTHAKCNLGDKHQQSSHLSRRKWTECDCDRRSESEWERKRVRLNGVSSFMYRKIGGVNSLETTI